MNPRIDRYQEVLADLDELLANEPERNEAWVIDAARQLGRVRSAGRSLANAVRSAIRDGDVINSSKAPLIAALRQWHEIDPQ